MNLSLSKLAELTGVRAETCAKRIRARGLRPASRDGRAALYGSRTALPIVLGTGGPGAERARLDPARADLAELELRRRRGELLEVGEVKSTWADRALSWRERLRGLPGQALVHVPGFDKAMARKLGALVDETLVELADAKSTPRAKGRASPERW